MEYYKIKLVIYMKNQCITTILVLLLSMISIQANAHWFYEKNSEGVWIYYGFNNDKTKASVCRDASGEYYYSGRVVIPKTVTSTAYNKTCPVTSIEDNAFDDCTNLTTLIIPNTVTSIGNYAFSGCSGLISVTMDRITPPSASSYNPKLSNTTLYVPTGSKTAYEAAVFWKDFKEIVEIPNITLADSKVKALCIANWDYNDDGELSETEAAAVTSIGTMFQNNTEITSFDELPYFTGLTAIESRAFSGCSNLVSISLPNVSTINYAAFDGCSSLTKINIPRSVSSIGDHAFSDCNSLQKVTVNWRETYTIPSIDNTVFPNRANITLYIPFDRSTTYGDDYGYADYWKEFKERIEVVGFNCALTKRICVDNWDTNSDGELSKAECAAVTDLGSVFQRRRIRDFEELYYFTGLTELGDRVFEECTDLRGTGSGVIPNSVTKIGSSAFRGCTRLVVIEFNNSLVSIGSSAFEGCTGLRTLYLNSANSLTSIGDRAFYGCSGLTDVTIPNNVTSIGNYAFSGCSDLTSVTIGNNVTTIGNYAFSGCSDLTSVTIPNSVTSIGNSAFRGCSGLTSFTIPNSVTSISQNTFYGCTSLASITIPGSVTSIEAGAFSGCPGLNKVVVTDIAAWCGIEFASYNDNPLSIAKHLYSDDYKEIIDLIIPNSVTSIGNYAFYGCSGLTDVTIPNTVKSIGAGSFSHCGLTSVIIPNGVTSIGYSAFANCSDLTSITIPNSVTSIENVAFGYCNVTNVTVYLEEPVTISSYTFTNSTNATLYVPIGSKDSYLAAYYWKSFKNIIEMGDDITISSAGMGTFCSSHPLDFSGTDDVKAYIVSALKPSTGEVTLTRITDVPANTGIVVKGDAATYSIPWGAGETVVANMLVGVTENTVLNKVNGDYTNYILAKKNGNLGFYAVSDGSTLSAGKAYLPLPTAQLPSNAGARQMTMIFDDETTGIQQNISRTELSSDYYDLQGRHISMPTRGLYIVNGKKVVIK